MISFAVFGQGQVVHGYNDAQKAMDYFNKGAEKAKAEKYKEAINDFDKAIALDKTLSEFYYNRGFCEVKLNDYEAAIPDFNMAIKLRNKTFTDALFYRGYCYNKIKMYVPAISDFTKALEVSSTSQLWSERGYAYFQTQDYENAVSDYTNAIAMDSKNIELVGLRALCQYQLHHLKESIEDADKYLSVKPESPDILVVEIKAKCELKDNEGAYETALKMLKVQKSPTSYYYMGLTEFYTKKYKEGITDFSKVIQFDARYREAYYGRALCYLGLNDDDHACPDLRKAAELGYPNLVGRIEDYCKGVNEGK